MGHTGRPRKPVEMHIADGTFRSDRHAVVPIAPLVRGELDETGRRFLPCPESVARLEGGADVWRTIVETIIDSGILRESDASSLEMAAAALARWRAAMETLSREGWEVDGKFGPVAHPAVAVMERAEMAWLRWSARFGLTPSDRAALGMALIAGQKAQAGADDWDDLDDGGE